MGGFGSGRFKYGHAKKITRKCPWLDVRRLHRDGKLRPLLRCHPASLQRRTKMELNPDQLKFAHHYVHNLDTKKAALHAGFTARYGHQLYDMPEVRAEIDKRLEIVRTAQAELKELHAMDRKKAESRRRLHKVSYLQRCPLPAHLYGCHSHRQHRDADGRRLHDLCQPAIAPKTRVLCNRAPTIGKEKEDATQS